MASTRSGDRALVQWRVPGSHRFLASGRNSLIAGNGTPSRMVRSRSDRLATVRQLIVPRVYVYP